MHIRKNIMVMLFGITIISSLPAHAYDFTVSSLWNSFKQNRTAHIVTGFCAVVFGVYAVRKGMACWQQELRIKRLENSVIAPENKKQVRELVAAFGIDRTEQIIGTATTGNDRHQKQMSALNNLWKKQEEEKKKREAQVAVESSQTTPTNLSVQTSSDPSSSGKSLDDILDAALNELNDDDSF